MNQDVDPTARYRTATWVLAGLSAVAVVVANASGLAISDDGIGYLAIADHVAKGRGLGYFLEPHLTTWPPLWPALMAGIAKITPLTTSGAAVALNALAAAAAVLLTAAVIRRLVTNERLAMAGVAVAALGSSTVLFGHILSTDFAFAVVVVALVLLLIQWRDNSSMVTLAAAAGAIWLAFAFRYAGIALIPAAVVWIALDRTRPRRFVTAIGVGVVSAVVPVAWMLRNHSVDGTFLGARYPSSRGVIGNTFDTLAAIGSFVVPGVKSDSRSLWAGVGLICIVVMAVLCWQVYRRRPTLHSATGLLDAAASPVGLLVIGVVVYLAYLIYARSTTAFDQITFRFLIPVYLPLVIVALVVVDQLLDGDRRWAAAGRGVVGAWAAVSLVVGLAMVPYFASGPRLFDGNYNSDPFARVRSSAILEQVPRTCHDESNLPSALYRSGIDAQWSPRLGPLNSTAHYRDLAELPTQVAAHSTCLLWIDLAPRMANVIPLAQLRRVVDVHRVASDGALTLYVLRAK